MADKMEQEVGSGALAIQSNRDTNIGFTPEQVMDAIAAQIPAFGTIAREIVEARVADFKAEILKKLAANEARIDAFSDPAFVNTVNTAEKSYAFSNDATVQSVLLDLIGSRSKETTRSRKSLTFDQAVEVSGNLTKSDFAALSLCFLFRYTANGGINEPDAFALLLRSHIDPFIDDVSSEHSAYAYLEAQRCATIPVSSATFEAIIRGNYGGVISKGITAATLREHIPNWEFRRDLFLPCMHAPELMQLAALNRAIWDSKAEGLEQDISEKLWSTFEATFMDREEIISAYEGKVPNLRVFAQLWENTPLQQLQLTTIGMCIGFINAKRIAGLDADLGVWIK